MINYLTNLIVTGISWHIRI